MKCGKIHRDSLIPIAAISLILLCIAAYFYTFSKGLSADSNDWGNFGSYIGGISGFAFSFLAIYITSKMAIDTRNSSKVDDCMRDIIASFSKIESLIIKADSFNKQIIEHGKNTLINMAVAEQTGGVDTKLEGLNDIYANCISQLRVEFVITTRNLNLCFNRFNFKYPGKQEITNSINAINCDLGNMIAVCDLIRTLIKFYSLSKS